jgi:hypothetical protein
MRALVLLAAVSVVLAEDDRPQRRVADPALQKKINTAIDKGVAFLKREQEPDGNWSPHNPGYQYQKGKLAFEAGLTALATYALAASGVGSGDASIKRALRWMETDGKGGFESGAGYATYSVSLYVLALTRINAERHQAKIHTLARQLVRGQRENGMWTYGLGGGRGGGDNSNTQFAVVAIWAAYSLAEFDVPETTWKRIRHLYESTQAKNGGWGYGGRAGEHGTPAMTCAGLCGYVYASAALDDSRAALRKARTSRIAVKAFDSLLRALGPSHHRSPYVLYGLERAGTIMNAEINKWYTPAARTVVLRQHSSGGWGMQGTRPKAYPYDTSLVLLFLSRSTLPPRRGVTTPGDRAGRGVVSGTNFPDLMDPSPGAQARLERALILYGHYPPSRRAAIAPLFAAKGPEVLRYLISQLRSEETARREAASDLLGRLLERKLYFEPKAPQPDRTTMVHLIEKFWRNHGPKLRWDPDKKRFVVVE